MSLDILKQLVDANPGVPDGSLQRVRAVDIVAAVDELPAGRLDRKAKDIRLGSANFMREQPSEDKRDSCTVLVPILYARHLLALAGPEPAAAAAEPPRRKQAA